MPVFILFGFGMIDIVYMLKIHIKILKLSEMMGIVFRSISLHKYFEVFAHDTTGVRIRTVVIIINLS
jgi:hypothetical protein